MSREKQIIEEMAKAVAISRGYGCDNRDHCDISCYKFRCGCIPYECAEFLYNAGYRKQSEVAKDISRDIIEPIWDAYKNSTSEETVLLVAFICEGINAQLKKKYMEE